jgi:hypothetical protein
MQKMEHIIGIKNAKLGRKLAKITEKFLCRDFKNLLVMTIAINLHSDLYLTTFGCFSECSQLSSKFLFFCLFQHVCMCLSVHASHSHLRISVFFSFYVSVFVFVCLFIYFLISDTYFLTLSHSLYLFIDGR